MPAPTMKCEKTTTQEGKDQNYEFYVLVDSIDAAGNPVQTRRTISKTTLEQLTTQIARLQSMQALAQAAT